MLTRLFAATVTLVLVVQARDAEAAVCVVEGNTYINGMPRHVGQVIEVSSLDQLPAGWDGGELAFGVPGDSIPDHSIRYWIQNPDAAVTRIFKTSATLTIVVQAKDLDEATRAVDRHTSFDGMSRWVSPILEVTESSQLPAGWDEDSMAFSAWALDMISRRPIGAWLKAQAKKGSIHA